MITVHLPPRAAMDGRCVMVDDGGQAVRTGAGRGAVGLTVQVEENAFWLLVVREQRRPLADSAYHGPHPTHPRNTYFIVVAGAN